MPSRPVVTLYGRPDCHLCDEARAALLELRGEPARFVLREVDIDSTDALLAAYLERIPVVELHGCIVSELEFEPRSLGRFLDDARAPDG